jgi:hypothetical protein
MTQQIDRKAALRSAYMGRGLRSAKFQFPIGNVGIFMQATLAIIYLYLILLGYQMMGAVGVVLVSCLFLLALFAPVIYQLANMNRRTESVSEKVGDNTSHTDTEQEHYRRVHVQESH